MTRTVRVTEEKQIITEFERLLDDLKQQLTDLPQETETQFADLMRIQTENVRQVLARFAPRSRFGSAHAADHLLADFQPDGAGRWRIIVTTEKGFEYLWFTVTGTRAHIIRPRKAGVLRWEDEGGGIHFARLVRHPGTERQDWVQQATSMFREGLTEVNLHMRDKIVEIMKREG